jgi:mRNA interferase HigB
MKVHLIKMQTIEDYVLRNARSRTSFDHWFTALKDADWNEPKDIITSYGTADNLGNNTNRVVFNIAGNNYRMICKYYFGTKRIHLFICWIGTHAEYTELCKQQKQYYINNY